MKKNVILIAIAGVTVTTLLFIAAGFAIASSVPEYATHYHANFAVFVNNTQVNFAKPELMHLKPCKPDDDPALHPKLENIHLHDMVGNVVHIHDDGLRWADLFTSITYDIAEDAGKNSLSVVYFLNGKKTDASVLENVVGKNDRLLITMTNEQLPDTVEGNKLLESQMEQVGSNAADYDKPGQSTESCSGNAKRTWESRLRIGLNRIF